MKYIIILIILIILLFSIPCSASVFLVNSNADTSDANLVDGICLDANGNCTLRAAVEQANSLASDDVITFSPTVNLITLTIAEITIENNGTLQIVGNGANVLTISGAASKRIFYMNGASVTISGLLLTGGNGLGQSPNGFGGAIFANAGSLEINALQVKGNTGDIGGGVFVGGGTYRIVNSTISGNSSRISGGVVNQGGLNNGIMTILNSTISGNSTSLGDGGGFSNFSTAVIRNTTITKNSAAATGGGIINFGEMSLGNTIVAENIATSSPDIRVAYTTLSAGNNLIGNSANTSSPITYQSTDILDTPPLLGALQNNGGTTPTHALLTGSPAIDKGNNALAADSLNNPLLFDQRGTPFSRITDGDGDLIATVDIGAFEKPLGTTATAGLISGRVTDRKGRGIFRAIITLTDSRGEQARVSTNPFGYYRIEAASGNGYVLTATHKQFTFTPRTVFVSENLQDADFTANMKF